MSRSSWGHAARAAVSVLLGLGAGVLANVWVSSASWAAGLGLLVTGILWAGLESWRAIADRREANGGSYDVVQNIRDASHVSITGIHNANNPTNIRVKQLLTNVKHARVFGVGRDKTI